MRPSVHELQRGTRDNLHTYIPTEKRCAIKTIFSCWRGGLNPCGSCKIWVQPLAALTHIRYEHAICSASNCNTRNYDVMITHQHIGNTSILRRKCLFTLWFPCWLIWWSLQGMNLTERCTHLYRFTLYYRTLSSQPDLYKQTVSFNFHVRKEVWGMDAWQGRERGELHWSSCPLCWWLRRGWEAEPRVGRIVQLYNEQVINVV
jgi:hypothetical protein